MCCSRVVTTLATASIHFLNAPEEAPHEMSGFGRAQKITQAKICDLPQTKSVAEIIVQAVFSTLERADQVTEMVGRLFYKGLDEWHLYHIMDASTTPPISILCNLRPLPRLVRMSMLLSVSNTREDSCRSLDCFGSLCPLIHHEKWASWKCYSVAGKASDKFL